MLINFNLVIAKRINYIRYTCFGNMNMIFDLKFTDRINITLKINSLFYLYYTMLINYVWIFSEE